MALSPGPPDGIIERLAQFAHGAFSKLVFKSALAGALRLCYLTPLSWAFAYYFLREDRFGTQCVGAAVFIAGLLPLFSFIVDHRYMVRHRPELLRSEAHEYRMAKLYAGSQGKPPRVIDASGTEAIPNPEATEIAALGENR